MGTRTSLVLGIILLTFWALNEFFPKSGTNLPDATVEAAKDPRAACASAVVTENLRTRASDLIGPPNEPVDAKIARLTSVEATIAKRRLEESYCLKLDHCLTDGSSLALGAALSGCLSDEANEKYRGGPD